MPNLTVNFSLANTSLPADSPDITLVHFMLFQGGVEVQHADSSVIAANMSASFTVDAGDYTEKVQCYATGLVPVGNLYSRDVTVAADVQKLRPVGFA